MFIVGLSLLVLEQLKYFFTWSTPFERLFRSFAL